MPFFICARKSCNTWSIDRTSRLAVGSSRINTTGSRTNARANARRRRCPPDQSPPASPIVSFNVIPFFCNIWLIPSARQLASSRTFDILALPSVCCHALSLRIGNLLAAHTVPHHGSLPGRGFWHRYCLGKMCLEQVPENSLAPAPMRFYQCRLGLLKRLSALVAILHREGAAALVHCNQLVNGQAAIDGLA